MAVQCIKLSETERASTGFTHKWLFSRTSASVADYTSTTIFILHPLVTNAIVRNVAIRVVVASDATTSAVLNIGDTGSIVQFITTAVGDVKSLSGMIGPTTTHKLYTATDALKAKVVETGTVTVGTFAVYASIIDLNSLDAGTSW